MTHPDPRRPGLTTDDTRWLISEAQRVLTDLGETSTVVDGVALAPTDERTFGLDNLARTISRMPRRRWARAVRVDPRIPTSWVEFLDSSDAYGAARVVVLPEVVRRVLRTDFPPHGLLVAVPTKFELWVHVPVDDDVVQTALAMSWLAYRTWAEEPYPISPDVFLVSPDMHAVCLVKPDQEGCDLDERAALELVKALERGEEREAG